MKVLSIPTIKKKISGIVKLPASKSITNRALLLSALAQGTSTLHNPLLSEDTEHMVNVLYKLGIKITKLPDRWIVEGQGGQLAPYKKEIYVGNAGTVARFLVPILTLGQGEYFLNGNQRMQERPIKDLINCLNNVGCHIEAEKKNGCLPLKIYNKKFCGGKINIQGSNSSQYVSAIMLAAPYAQNDTEINIENSLVSLPYVEMTKKMMEIFQVQVEWKNSTTIKIRGSTVYQPQEYFIESDASSASYFQAAAAITGGTITFNSLKKNSLQGDIRFLEILSKMGACIRWQGDNVIILGKNLSGITVDMNAISDLVPTLAVTALFAEGTTKITNVANIRIKESDRLAALSTQLKKIGASLSEFPDGLLIEGKKNYSGAELETYDDHRLAMAFSLLGLKISNITIQNPQCVNKTFPQYFKQFFQLYQ